MKSLCARPPVRSSRGIATRTWQNAFANQSGEIKLPRIQSKDSGGSYAPFSRSAFNALLQAMTWSNIALTEFS
jgi:hypothetical protein